MADELAHKVLRDGDTCMSGGPNVYIARAGDEVGMEGAGKTDGGGSGVPVGAQSPQGSVLIISSGQGCKSSKDHGSGVPLKCSHTHH